VPCPDLQLYGGAVQGSPSAANWTMRLIADEPVVAADSNFLVPAGSDVCDCDTDAWCPRLTGSSELAEVIGWLQSRSRCHH
jgi:hypothetical protein